MLSDVISCYINAQIPVLYLIGSEEERYLSCIRKIKNDDVITWNCVSGLDLNGLEEDTSAPVNLLRFVNNEENPDSTYILLDFHPFMENPSVVRLLKQFITVFSKKRGRKLIILSSIKIIPVELEKDIVSHELPYPDSREIYSCLTGNIQKMMQGGIRTDSFSSKEHLVKTIESLKGLTIKQIDHLLARSISEKRMIDPDFLFNEKNRIIASQTPVKSVETGKYSGFKSLGGMNILKNWLKLRKPFFIRSSSQEISGYNLPLPKGILLTGVQGCGKSMAATIIAGEWNLPLLQLDIGQVFSSRVGASEDSLRSTLSAIESMEPCVLLIDEFEKGFSGVKSSGLTDGGTSARVFSYFLSWMQDRSKRVFIVATANDVFSMPPEILRKGRFDELFFVDLPTQSELTGIYEIYLKHHNLKELTGYAGLFASESAGFSGAEVKQIIVEALYSCLAAGRSPGKRDLSLMIHKTVPLSESKKEEIESLREWAEGRYIPVSGVKRGGNEDHIVKFPENTFKVIKNG